MLFFEKKLKKLMSAGTGLMFLLSESTALAAGLTEAAPVKDISVLEQAAEGLSGEEKPSGVKAAVSLLSKGFDLTEYEMLIISEVLRQELEKNPDDKETLETVKELQRKYGDEYKEIFDKLPDEASKKAGAEKKEETKGRNDEPSWTPPAQSFNEKERTKGKESSAEAEAEGAAKAETPEEMVSSLSLINIKDKPSSSREEGEYRHTNPYNPIQALNAEGLDFSPSEDKEKEEEKNYAQESLNDILDAIAEAEDRKVKHFFLSVRHNISYVDDKGEGNVPLDPSSTNDYGDYDDPLVTNQHEVDETLEIGLGIRVHKALDLIVSMIAENEDGLLNESGTTWEFGNVLFKFHPERADKATLKKLDSEGIIIRDGGRIVGKRIGHGTEVTTDSETGDTTMKYKNGNISYSHDEGLRFMNEDTRYYIGFGKLSLDFSTYTLKLSDCKAVEVGYHDNDQKFVVLYGRPDSDTYDTVSEEGIAGESTMPKRELWAAQYVTNKLIPDISMAFNFAKSRDLKKIAGHKSKSTVYSLFVKDLGDFEKTSFEGEFAHSIVNYDTKYNIKTKGNADYLDINHDFSKNLRGYLHLVNIDGSFDSSSLVEDTSGEHIHTKHDGDGMPDYIYKTGQRGFDLTLDYDAGGGSALSFGLSRYTETEDGNEKTDFYLSGNKQWKLGDSYGNDKGTVNLQQRFESRTVSGRDYDNLSSDTTLSYNRSPWGEDGNLAVDLQRITDRSDGNETRLKLDANHTFYPADRVTVTPRMEYEVKKGSGGIDTNDNKVDSSTLINSLTIGYELIPDELTVNVLVSKERYNVIESEIDEATGSKVDGEKRNVLGAGIGLVYEPKKIEGLSFAVSYRKDKVDYLDRKDNSNQDVWEYTAEYARPLTDKIDASLSYNYKSTRDHMKPIYDDITRTIELSLDARIGRHSTLSLRHSYDSTYKPLDPAANSKTHTTSFEMTNEW